MTAINNKEYLKKYLSIGKAPGEKKKKKKKQKGISTGLKIVDDDVLVNISEEIQQDLDGDQEDAPQIASVIDDRPPSLRVDEDSHLKLWKPIGSVNDEENTSKGVKLDTAFKLNKPKSQSLVPKIPLKKVFASKKQNKSHDSDFSPPRMKIKQEQRSPSIEKDNSNIVKQEVLSPVRSDNSSLLWKDSSMSPRRKIKRENSEDSTPPRKNRRHSSEDNSPPRRKNDSDNSSSFKGKKDKDMSPSRRRRDPDNSPRKIRRERSEDYSPPRRHNDSDNLKNDKDRSPSRKIRNSDNSPPRKHRRQSSEDNSPPRRKKYSDNSSFQRKKDKDMSAPKRRRDSDSSPPRKTRRQSSEDNSPPRRKTDTDKSSGDRPPRRGRSSDNSPPRKHRRQSSEDNSPPRKKNDPDKSSGRKKSRWDLENEKMTKTLEGKTAGLQNSLDLARETEEMKRRTEELFKNMSAETSGKNAQTVIRNSMRKKQKEVDPEEEERKRIRDEQNKEKYDRWGKGLKQVEAQNAKIDEMVHEMNKPLARYADDQDLESYLKDQEREGDPMLAYMRKRKRKTHTDSEKPLKARFEGEYPPNRFGIPPGYRWDGVDRSNEYEKKYFEVQNKKKADLDEAYKWSTEDM